MTAFFSKPCPVVGRPVFDHLPLDAIETSFSANPPLELLTLYRTFGRGTLCAVFEFGPCCNVVALEGWTNQQVEEALPDSEVCELIGAGTRLGIGYGRSGRYYLLDFDNDTFRAGWLLEEMMEIAANYRGVGGALLFPFFVCAGAATAGFFVKPGERFFELSRKVEIAGLRIGHYVHDQGAHTLLFDQADRFVATLLPGVCLNAEGQWLLWVYYDAACEGFELQCVFDLLNEIAGGKFQVVRPHF